MREAIGPPKVIIVFIVGGATFEEAAKVAEWNASPDRSTRVLLGGSCIPNSTSFLAEVAEAVAQGPPSHKMGRERKSR